MESRTSSTLAGVLFFMAALCYLLPGPLIRAAVDPPTAVATSLSRAGGAVRSGMGSRLILIGDDPWGTPYFSEERKNAGAGIVFGQRWGTGAVGSSTRVVSTPAGLSLPIYEQRSLGPDGVDQQGRGDDVVIDPFFVREQGVGKWSRAGKLAIAWDSAWLLAIVLGWVGFQAIGRQRGARRETIYVAIQSLWPVVVVGIWTWSSLRRGSTWPLRQALRLLANQSPSEWSVLLGSYPLFFLTGLATRLFLAPAPEPEPEFELPLPTPESEPSEE